MKSTRTPNSAAYPHVGPWRSSLGRLPTLAQVADTAVFLASDRAGAITGTVADLTSGNAVRAHQFGQALIGLLD